MTGVDVAIASFESEAEEEERYLVANRDRTCGECANCKTDFCDDGYGMCSVLRLEKCLDDDEIFVRTDYEAIKNEECMNFNERNDR